MYDRISGEQWLNTKEQQLGALNSLESAHCQNLGLQPNLGWDVLAPHVTNVGFGVEMRHSWLRYPMKFMNLWHSRPPVMPSYVEWIWFISLFTLILYTISAVKKKCMSPFKDSTTFTMRGLSDSKEIRALSAVLQAFETMAMIELVPWGVACCAAGNHVVPTTVSSNMATEKNKQTKWMFMAGK